MDSAELAKKVGIISTYVENTILDILLFLLIKDHLHLRGEYKVHSKSLISNVGSSPLTWRIH